MRVFFKLVQIFFGVGLGFFQGLFNSELRNAWCLLGLFTVLYIYGSRQNYKKKDRH